MRFDIKKFLIQHGEKVALGALVVLLLWGLVPSAERIPETVRKINTMYQDLGQSLARQERALPPMPEDMIDPQKTLAGIWGEPALGVKIAEVSDKLFYSYLGPTLTEIKTIVLPPASVEAVPARGAIVVAATVEVEKQLPLIPKKYRREAAGALPGGAQFGAGAYQPEVTTREEAGVFLKGFEVWRKQEGVDEDYKLVATKIQDIPLSTRPVGPETPTTFGPALPWLPGAPGMQPTPTLPKTAPRERTALGAGQYLPAPPAEKPTTTRRTTGAAGRAARTRETPPGIIAGYQGAPGAPGTYPYGPGVGAPGITPGVEEEEEEEKIELPEGDVYYLDKDVKNDEFYQYKVRFLALNPQASPGEEDTEKKFIGNELAQSPESKLVKVLDDIRFFFLGGTPNKVSLMVQKWIYAEKEEEEEKSETSRTALPGLASAERAPVGYGTGFPGVPRVPGMAEARRKEPSELEVQLGVGGGWKDRTFVIVPGQKIGTRTKEVLRKGDSFVTEEFDFFTGCTLVDVVSTLKVTIEKTKTPEFTEKGSVKGVREEEELRSRRVMQIIYLDRKGRMQTLEQGAPPTKTKPRLAPAAREKLTPGAPGATGIPGSYGVPGAPGAGSRTTRRSTRTRRTRREEPTVAPGFPGALEQPGTSRRSRSRSSRRRGSETPGGGGPPAGQYY